MSDAHASPIAPQSPSVSEFLPREPRTGKGLPGIALKAAALGIVFVSLFAFLAIDFYRFTELREFDTKLKVAAYEMVAVNLRRGAQGLVPPPLRQDKALYNHRLSGWYWQIKQLGPQNTIVLKSQSLEGWQLSHGQDHARDISQRKSIVDVRTIVGPGGRRVRAAEIVQTIGSGDKRARYSFLITAQHGWIENAIADLVKLFAALIAPILVLSYVLTVVLAQMRWWPRK